MAHSAQPRSSTCASFTVRSRSPRRPSACGAARSRSHAPAARPSPEVERPPRADFLSFSPHTVGERRSPRSWTRCGRGWITTGPRDAAVRAASSRPVSAPPARWRVNSCTAGAAPGAARRRRRPRRRGHHHAADVLPRPSTSSSTSARRRCSSTSSRDTLNIDPAAVGGGDHAAHRSALIPVHFAGQPADMDALWQLAAAHGLARDRGRRARAAGERTAGGRSAVRATRPRFSFYATKNLTTGEGGMLTGDPRCSAERPRRCACTA